MKERFYWIDWAKALAVMSIVLCHIPQSQEWLYYRFLQATVLSIFFFISGFLKKDYGNTKANWQKYWHHLIIPYIFYNLIIYPYWIVKEYIINGELPNIFYAIKPLIGALLFEHESSISEPLNGPLWYLPAILLMHVTTDLCRKTKYQYIIITILCIISFILYAANKYSYFAPQLTPMGIMRNLPFYFMGYVLGQNSLFHKNTHHHYFISSIIWLTSSILLFAWHLHAYFEGQHLLHIIIFYPVNITFIIGILHACKSLESRKSTIIVNLSIGTIVIIGLHTPVISLFNLILEQLFEIHNGICYHWYEAVPIAAIICALLYPIIIWGGKYAPWMIGWRNVSLKSD